MRPDPGGSGRLVRAGPIVALAWAAASGVAALLSSESTADADGPSVAVTESTTAAKHFAPRGNEELDDSYWGEWINRLDALLRDGRWTAGLRIDSAVYWSRPMPYDPGAALFHDAVYPAKVWLTYSARGLEITAGDSYVQFGRGLTLSMRKID